MGIEDRFTAAARAVVAAATDEARTAAHAHVDGQHLFLGLLGAADGVAGAVLRSFGITADDVRGELLEAVAADERAAGDAIAFGARGKRVLESALRRAQALGRGAIDTEHILLALLCEDDLARALQGRGASAQAIGDAVLIEARGLDAGAHPGGGQSGLSPTVEEVAGLAPRSSPWPPSEHVGAVAGVVQRALTEACAHIEPSEVTIRLELADDGTTTVIVGCGGQVAPAEPRATDMAEPPPLTAHAQADLLKRAQRGDLEARQDLIDANTALVVSVARAHRDHGVALVDLVRAGLVGLTRAIDRFDPAARIGFDLYAEWWIRQAIVRALPSQPPS
jgi:hypothetical protein